jgi:hypothetical protein
MGERVVLGLNKRTIVFPDGRPYCLICGAPATGSRQVWFEDIGSAGPAHGIPGDKGYGLDVGVQAIRSRLTFDAPLCRVHRRQALFLSLKAVGLFLLSVGILVAGGMVIDRLKLPRNLSWVGQYAPFVPALPVAIVAGVLWKRKDRGGLTCKASSDQGRLVLEYESPLPRPPLN